MKILNCCNCFYKSNNREARPLIVPPTPNVSPVKRSQSYHPYLGPVPEIMELKPDQIPQSPKNTSQIKGLSIFEMLKLSNLEGSNK